MPVFRGGGGRTVGARDRGSIVNVTFDTREFIRLVDQIKGESTKLGYAAQDAHKILAQRLQNEIADVLEAKVEARQREQRDKDPDSRLGAAIRSEENRRVSQQGYTVGYLDEIPAVRQYWRGLEEGTSKHVGRYLHGVFRNNAGETEYDSNRNGTNSRPRMVKGGGDATFRQWSPHRYEAPFFPGVKIKNAIIGYHYFDGGIRNFMSKGGDDSMARDVYQEMFDHYGLGHLSRAMNEGAGMPSNSRYTNDL